ncbi:MAG: alkaline phosphatase family protein [Acidimicrobiales bacterium]
MDQPVLPDYAGACISNIVPALLDGTVEPPPWLPELALDASQVVLLVLDGLGWEQLGERRSLAPTLCSLLGGPITTVSPSTTATALTSIATGLAPGRHGVVGYRVAVDHEVLNILRWSTPEGDARARIVPEKFQPTEAFCGQRAAMVTKAEFATSGFSAAHLGGARFRGYRVPSTMVVELGAALRAGEPFVYAYYDGIDKVSHEYGLADHYDAELVAVDRLVGDVLGVLPAVPRSWSPPTTGRSTWATGCCHPTPTSPPTPRSSPARAASGGSTPAPVGRTPCSRRRAPTTTTWRGS